MSKTSPLKLKPHNVIVFQGNSITDAGRNRLQIEPNTPAGLGGGYPAQVAERLLEEGNPHALQIYNRGVSGDELPDLHRRWERDTLPLLPDVLSILIGINDLWLQVQRGAGFNRAGTELLYRKLLEITRKELPYTDLILCQPFLLTGGQIPVHWQDPAQELGKLVRELAEEFGAVFVPFQQALDAAAEEVSSRKLLSDGVHPTPRGHRILAECWLEHVLGKAE